MSDVWVLVLASPFVTCLVLELAARLNDDAGTARDS